MIFLFWQNILSFIQQLIWQTCDFSDIKFILLFNYCCYKVTSVLILIYFWYRPSLCVLVIIAPDSYYRDKNGVLMANTKRIYRCWFLLYIKKYDVKFNWDVEELCNWYHRNCNSVTTRATLLQFFLTKMEFREKNNRNQIEKSESDKQNVILSVLEKEIFFNII